MTTTTNRGCIHADGRSTPCSTCAALPVVGRVLEVPAMDLVVGVGTTRLTVVAHGPAVSLVAAWPPPWLDAPTVDEIAPKMLARARAYLDDPTATIEQRRWATNLTRGIR